MQPLHLLCAACGGPRPPSLGVPNQGIKPAQPPSATVAGQAQPAAQPQPAISISVSPAPAASVAAQDAASASGHQRGPSIVFADPAMVKQLSPSRKSQAAGAAGGAEAKAAPASVPPVATTEVKDWLGSLKNTSVLPQPAGLPFVLCRFAIGFVANSVVVLC